MPRNRAVLPYNEPGDLLAQQLESSLQAEAADVYAGLTRAPDGTIQLHVTVSTPDVARLIEQVVAAVQSTHPDAHRLPEVERIVGARNSLRSLERVRDRIRIRHLGLESCGIRITLWGVDVWNNRVRIEVRGLTPEAKATLEAEFGPEMVDVLEGGVWLAYATRQQTPGDDEPTS